MFKKKRQQKIFDVMKNQMNECFNYVRDYEKNGWDRSVALHEGSISRITSISCELMKQGFITHNQYRKLYEMEVNFYREKHQQKDWIQDTLEAKKDKMVREQLILDLFGFLKDGAWNIISMHDEEDYE